MTQNTSLTTQQLITHLDHYLNVSAFEDNAINGLQVGNSGPVAKIATAVSASLEVIENAIELKVQVLIVHHGILKKNNHCVLIDSIYHKIALLIQHNIALICYHLPLDAHHEIGNNWKAAGDLGLQNSRPFMELNKQYMGVIGSIEPLSFEHFKTHVEQYYGRTAQAVKAKDTVSKIAIISGKADRCIIDAVRAGADCFITGTNDEPVWDIAREEGISFLSLGHYTTEMVGPKALVEYIQKTFSISCEFIKTDNPF